MKTCLQGKLKTNHCEKDHPKFINSSLDMYSNLRNFNKKKLEKLMFI